jgi:hypothetical protein
MGLPSFRPRTRPVRVAAVVASMLALQSTVLSSVAFAQAPDAKSSLANGNKAAGAKDWAKAVTDFEASNKAAPSADALEGVANAHYQQKHDTEAYAAYDEWLKTYAAKAAPAKKKAVEARLKELGDRTGLLAVDTTETGATIAVDDKPMGTTPLSAPLRLAVGPHRVRITKEGFQPFDQVPNVAAGATSTVQVKLEAQTTKGRISVKEKTGKPIRVTVDGVDMGDAPWTGEVDAGAHEVGGRGAGVVAAPEKITVERGKVRDVELAAATSIATLKIGTSDGKGLIYLDNKVVGEGTFTSDVPSGTHTVRITREGYDPFEEQIELKDKETLSRSVTLKLSSKIETGAVQKDTRALEGVYGGFGLLMTFLPSGMNSSMQKTCDGQKPAELISCDGQGGGIGGGLDGFIGYHWDPVGVELFAGAQYDQNSPTLHWGPSSTDPGLGPDPARTEEFHIRRIGGFGIFRVRLTLQGEKLRFSVAGGVGLSYRSMLLTRDTTAVSNPALRDAFVPDAQSYLSPVVSLEPSLQYRLGPSTAVALGVSMLVESPRTFDRIPTTKAEGGHSLGPSGLTTPAYQLATGTQVFIGPFIGMMFGP